MSSKSHIKTLFDYHWHTTQRLMDCAAKLEADDYRATPGYGHGSVHDLLFHLLRTDRSWRLALETGKQLPPIQPADFVDLAALKVGFAEEQAAWDAMLGLLSAEAVSEAVEMTNWRGEPVTFMRWRVFQHLMLHGMQHHSELAALLTAKGQSPGNIDFIFFDA